MRRAVTLLWRSRLRSAPRRILVLALITALGGGVCLAVAAGAKRTDNAYAEVLTLTHSAELGSSYIYDDPNDVEGPAELLRSTPAIDDFNQIVGYQVFLPETAIAGLVSYAMYGGVGLGQPIVIAGRLPTSANEVFVNEAFAEAAGVTVGDQLEVVIASPDFVVFVPETLSVIGVGILNDEVYEDETSSKPALLYSKAFVAAHPGIATWQSATFSLQSGVTREEAIAQLAERGVAIDDDRNVDRHLADQAIRPLVITLWTLALLAAVATITLVGQGLQRIVRRSPTEARGLLAIGWSRSTLLLADVAVAATVGFVGAIGAIGVAIALSPVFPQGQARRIEVLRGVDVDVATLAFGALALTVALSGMVALVAFKSGRSGESRPGKAPGVLGSTPACGTGIRFATGRRGLLGTVTTAAVGLTTIVAGVVFIGSLNNLISRPDLAGFDWDLMGLDSHAAIDTAAVVDQLQDVQGVERITGLTFVDAAVNGTPVPGSVWAALDGLPWPPIINGRAPAAPNEMLVGPETLRAIESHIGETVTVEFGDGPAGQTTAIEMTIVGTAVSPAIGIGGTDTPRLNDGVLFRSEDIVGLASTYGGAVLFDLDDQSDAASIIALFPEGLPDDFDIPTEWFVSAEPAEVTQADSASDVLVLAMIVLAIGVLAALGANLLGFVRERRNAFAVLKAVGFTPRQIRAAVLWQSGSVLALSLVVSVPLGLFFGRWLYQRFAEGIGVIDTPALAVVALLAVLFGTVLLVQATALLPAYQARRTRPASELRSE